MRSVLFSLAALLSFAKAAEDRVCLPTNFPCRTPRGCSPPKPFKHDGPCPIQSSELNEISPTADRKWRSCRKQRICRHACGPRPRPFDWKGPCPKGYNGMETRARVCKKRRCQGGAKKCTKARTTRCRPGEKEISPKDNPNKRLKRCEIKDCQIETSRYCSKSCSRRRCRIKVRGNCPHNTKTLKKRTFWGRSNGRTNGNDYDAGLVGIAIGNDYGAGDNEADDYKADDYEAGDYKDDDYEADDYKDDDYEDYDYEADDYEADDYEADDYEADDYEADDYEDVDYEDYDNNDK